jgi:hypothetical protein
MAAAGILAERSQPANLANAVSVTGMPSRTAPAWLKVLAMEK